MKKIVLIVLFCSLVSLPHLYAQSDTRFSSDFTMVSHYEGSMTEYENDKDAEALVIYEKGKYSFIRNEFITEDFELNMEKRIKIKILKPAGIKYATINIPYYVEGKTFFLTKEEEERYINDRERVRKIEATTYNYNSSNNQMSKVKLDLNTIVDEDLGNGWRVKKITMPDVKVGSVIELRYTIVSPFHEKMRTWEFQKDIPVLYSTLDLYSIPFFEYVYLLKGGTNIDKYKEEVLREPNIFYPKYDETISTFTMEKIPAFKAEEFVTAEKDSKISLGFQLARVVVLKKGKDPQKYISTWPLICDELLANKQFGGYVKEVKNEGKKILPTLKLKGSFTERAAAIEQYVKQNYKWDGSVDKKASKKAVEFIQQKTGNSADINLFLLGLLEAAGIKATPVVLSTRDNGAIPQEYPFESFLNYVIVQVSSGGSAYYLDATDAMLPFAQLPMRCLNVKGLEVQNKSNTWVTIKDNKLALTQKDFVIKVNVSSGKLQSGVSVKSYASDAYQYRSAYLNRKENLMNFLKNEGVEVLGEIKVHNYKEIDKPFEFEYETEQPVKTSNNGIVIAPFLNQAVPQNIFNQDERKRPIDLINLYAADFSSVIEIPEGYKVASLPKEINHDGKVMKVTYNAIEKDGKIVVTAGYVFKESLFPVKDYTFLKGTYGEMVKKFNEPIELVKE